MAFISNTGVYSALSDRRVKTNITPLAQGLRTVLALRPVSYDFHPSRRLDNGVVTFLPDDRPVRALGFVAQDLYQVVPEAVEKPADERRAFYTVSYTTLVPVLTQAIQEQQAQIEALKQQNAALQARAATAEAAAKAQATQATATLETFEARLRRLEAATSAQAQR
ncbi:MAG: tail fiber domain-containing protein [Janthinobacterium lividum]